MAHPNAELFAKGYAAFQAGDLDTVRDLFAPDIVWHVPGKSHLSGDYKGVDDTMASFLANMQETDGTFRLEVHDILGSDDHAVALATVKAEKDGKSLDDRYTHIVHIKDGKLTESWIMGEHQDEVDAFWG
jgi:ketosteroid isomerase-like protein